jgi:Phosphodiester glycosidase
MTGSNRSTKQSFTVAEWNTGGPGPGEIAGFTTYGGRYEKPRSGGCYARLKVWSKMHWGQSGVGVYRDYTVQARRCSGTYRVKAGTVALESRKAGAGAAAVDAMKKDQKVRLGWSLGWSGILGSISGMPLLADKGRNVAPPSTCHSYFCSANPRIGIAQTADGKILLVTVDGRSRGTSIGMTLSGFAKYLISLGAVTAVNLDGGGGTTMWVNGQGIANSPSDPWGERPVTSAVLVVASDAAEPIPLPYSRPLFRSATGPVAPVAAVSSTLARRAASLDANDPGSTGGLLDWLASNSSS